MVFGNLRRKYSNALIKRVSGGWLLVSNIVINSSPPSQLLVETSYRGLSNYHNNKMILNIDAMNQLRTHLSFTQLRFHCSKPQGRTFHVTTVGNSSGEAFVFLAIILKWQVPCSQAFGLGMGSLVRESCKQDEKYL